MATRQGSEKREQLSDSDKKRLKEFPNNFLVMPHPRKSERSILIPKPKPFPRPA